MRSELPSTPLKEITELIQQLTSIPSVESEQAIAICIAEKLTALRFEPHLIGDPEHPSVICHHQAATATKTIWLQSHLDTAPVGDRSQWQHDPFAGMIIGDRIYGRGVADSHAPNEQLNLKTTQPVFQAYWVSLVEFCLGKQGLE